MNALEELECAIIGACVCENAFARVAHILTTANFKMKFNKMLWESMLSLYPFDPIDVLTVYITVPDYGKYLGLAHHILVCQNLVNSSANIQYHAFILLNINIRDVFIQKLTELELQYLQEDKINEARDLKQIMNEVIESNTVFETIKKAILYFKSTDQKEVLAHLNDFENNLILKAEKIKKMSQMDTLINNLVNIYQVSNLNRDLIKLLAEAITNLTIKGQLPPNFKEDIQFKITAY